MGKASGAGKVFLFLQGPHGPFFYQLSKILHASGARVLKVGFNRGDQAGSRCIALKRGICDPIG